MVRGQREYDGDLRHLAPMRAFLRETCRQGWAGDPAAEDLIVKLALALTEAASNIILHGEPAPHQTITLTIEVDDDQACVTLQHAGKPFDPESAPAPAFDGSRESGFGLYLIRRCVDDVRYYQDDEGRCVMHLVLKRQQQHKG